MTVCLAMIVRDEAETIERCLASVRGQIDHWVIVDTGSTDDTPRRIAEELALKVPGMLHNREWVDFGTNRSELLALARDSGCDHLLLLDADMTLTGDILDLPSAIDTFDVTIDDGSAYTYTLPLIVRADRAWRYEGVTHEYLTTAGLVTNTSLPGVVVHHHLDGGHRPEKYERDRVLLEAAHATDPADARTVFYLAQTYRDLGRFDLAAQWYERRAGMGDWIEEVYVSHLEAGRAHNRLGCWAEAVEQFTAAWEVRSERLEAVYELATGYRQREQYRVAELFAQHADAAMPLDRLFVEPWVYAWGLKFEWSICTYWTGNRDVSEGLCDELLQLDIPEHVRDAVARNLQHCTAA